MREKVDLILQCGTLVTMNAAYDVIMDGAVAVAGDSIVAVGTAAQIKQQYSAPHVAEFPDKVLMPGMVNAHTHVPMTLLRGLNDDLRLDVWLGYLMPLERQFVTPDFVKLGTRLACAEMIRSGVTAFADMYYFEESIAEETAAIGMRALLGQTVLMFPAPDAATYEESLTLCRHFIENWNGHPLIQPAVAPHAWYTSTPEITKACADLAKEYDVPIHTHVAETRLEVENCKSAHHVPVVSWISQQGILETKLLAAHCVHINETEMFALKAANAGVAHCPTSNLKLASGIAPISKMIELGLNVGIGTDGPASNNDLDMVEETRLAALLAKTANDDPTAVPARQAVELATIGGARAIHMGDKIGSIEPGKRADLTIVGMGGVHNQPHFHNNPDAVYSRLVYAAKSSDISDVMCNGRWLMRDQELLTINESAALEAADKVAVDIDRFVLARESSPYNKLVLLSGVTREESFEVQVKAAIDDPSTVREKLNGGHIKIDKTAHYKQYDHYFQFDNKYPDAYRLRYREDAYIDQNGRVTQTRTRLTLLGDTDRQAFDNAVMLSRSRFLALADRSLRFYREYFEPDSEVEVIKERFRWRITFEETDFAINIDKLIEPPIDHYHLEIKARTWSRSDAQHKAAQIARLLELFEVDPALAERKEYADIALLEAERG